MFAKVKRKLRAEKFWAGLIYFSARVFERASGRIKALIAGWKNGYIGAYSRVIGTAFIKTGVNCSIGRFSWIEVVANHNGSPPKLDIGYDFSASERFHIACANKILIGNSCLIGSGVHITDHNHGVYRGEQQSHPETPPIRRIIESGGPVIVGSNVWIGDNVVIIGPVRIGDGSIIGSNSVVTRDVPSRTIAVGSPAVPIKYFDDAQSMWINI